MTKKTKKFFTAEEIKKMVLKEKKLPATTHSSCRYPIGYHKRKEIKYK